MPKQLLIFDLDGTLVDTSKDITNALNYAIKPYAIRELTVEDTIQLVGEGISRLIEKLAEKTSSGHKEEMRNRFLEYYEKHLTDYSTVYPQVRQTLEALRSYKKAVISNKRERLSRILLERLNLLDYFVFIGGSDSFPEKKPSPVPILDTLRQLGVKPQDTMIIGDSNFDIEAGKRAGTKTVAVSYGYRDKKYLQDADYIIDSFQDLVLILDIDSQKFI